MNRYDFKLTPAYCLFNGAGIKHQNGNEITFLIENTENQALKDKLKKAFASHLDFLRTKADCPEVYKQPEIISFEVGSRNDLRKYVSSLYEETEVCGESDGTAVHKMEVESAAVLLLDTIIDEACRKGATDIHIEDSRVRYRIQGSLIFGMKIDGEKSDELVRRIKLLAGLNVLESKKSQDGQFTYGEKQPVFVRVSTMSIVSKGFNSSAESVVLRLLDTSRIPLSILKLGFSGLQMEELEKITACKNGLFIICGPTGAGKSTTAAALLQEIAKQTGNQKKIISLEDPPEYFIPGVTQIKVDVERKNSFSEILKHIFRQDPDVIMIGEIRDEESCETALRASLTGHLVIATLHTNAVAASFLRLQNLGANPSVLCSVMRGILVQDISFYNNSAVLLAELAIPKRNLLKEKLENLTEAEIEEYFDLYTNAGTVLRKTIGNKKSDGKINQKYKAEIRTRNKKSSGRHLIDAAAVMAAEEREA